MQNLRAEIYIEICDDFETKEGFRKCVLGQRPMVFLQRNVGT